MQTQQSAYQQNWNRGEGSGPGGYQQQQQHQQQQQQQQQQQHYDRRRDDWHDRRDNRGQHHQGYSSGRGYPLPPPSRRYNWN